MENLDFLFAAYTAVWAMIFLYVWSMSRRTRRLEQQLDELLRLVQSRGGANPRNSAPASRRDDAGA